MLYFVGAHDKNFGMGFQGHLPWPRMAADIERLHALTKGKILLMGQRTYEEYKNLKRVSGAGKVYVLSSKLESLPDASVIHSIPDVTELSKRQDVWVVGGGSMFKQLLPYVKKMYLTRIEAEFEADTFFPSYDLTEWEVEEQQFSADDANPYPYSFLEITKK